MPNSLQIKRSTTNGAIPSSLRNGELAINQSDRVLYFLDSLGSIIPVDIYLRSTSRTSALISTIKAGNSCLIVRKFNIPTGNKLVLESGATLKIF